MVSKTVLSAAAAFALMLGVCAAGPQADCVRHACRPGGYLVILRGELRVPVIKSAYETANGILIFPGETLMFQLPVLAGRTDKPSFVMEYAPDFPATRTPPSAAALPKLATAEEKAVEVFPEGTTVVSYGQPKNGTGMILTLVHNVSQPLKFDVTVQGQKQVVTVCAPKPNRPVTQTWPAPAGPVTVQNFRLLAAGARCP